MYQLIPAEEKYLDQMVPLLYETGYYEYAALDNELNWPAAEFSKKYVLQPYLPYTSVLIDKTNSTLEKFAGFCTTFTKTQLKEVEKNIPNHYRDDPKLADVFARLDLCYEELSDQDLYAALDAIHPDYRGKGLYRTILQHRRALARKCQCSRIVLLVWQSNPAWQIFERYGIHYLGEMEFPLLPKADTLLKGFFEVA